MGPLRHSNPPPRFVQMKIECTVNINAEPVNLKKMELLIHTINPMSLKIYGKVTEVNFGFRLRSCSLEQKVIETKKIIIPGFQIMILNLLLSIKMMCSF